MEIMNENVNSDVKNEGRMYTEEEIEAVKNKAVKEALEKKQSEYDFASKKRTSKIQEYKTLNLEKDSKIEELERKLKNFEEKSEIMDKKSLLEEATNEICKVIEKDVPNIREYNKIINNLVIIERDENNNLIIDEKQTKINIDYFKSLLKSIRTQVKAEIYKDNGLKPKEDSGKGLNVNLKNKEDMDNLWNNNREQAVRLFKN